jgi:hypothetical protein
MKRLIILILLASITTVYTQSNTNNNKFKQLDDQLATPNTYRTASGAPGHDYWQQKADYKISIKLDDEQKRIYGKETITYYNQSPDVLNYLWLQLDQNIRAKDSHSYDIRESSIRDEMSTGQIERLTPQFDGGFNIDEVKDLDNKDLDYIINKTMLRINLKAALKPNHSYSFKIKWWYNINNTNEIGGRSGYEPFEPDSNNVYVIAQFYPRMCLYNDVYGWQNKQFLGRGEFTLTFGDFEVDITVPEDHLVAASGTLQNPKNVLSRKHLERLNEAEKSHVHPITIASYDEAEERIKNKATKYKTWKFKAYNVRDFAFASSRRFIWDAMGVPRSDGRTVMAMSMWTKEGDCLWKNYSTKAVAHTIKWYSHYTFDYPYPVAWSIDGSMGMEYPMICFNYGRCENDGTYSERTKYGHIGVIIHEVGHNWFPMIVNSDERQWTWMDEGLNTFLQYLTEQQWERDYPSRRGPANKIVSYMKGDKSRISPIMTNSESIFQFGNNAYGKPATALNILRESVMGRELFDYAFKEYANRWKFKHPTPSDFFRTMEDASAVDLDWFWRGWFYTNDHADQALSNVKYYQIDNKDPKKNSALAKEERVKQRENISVIRNRKKIKQTLNEIDTTINDYYTTYDPLDIDIIDKEEYEKYISSLSEKEKELINSGKHFYELEIENIGGLVMPVIIEFEYEDGSTEIERIPAEIWRFNQSSITKTFIKDKKAVNITLDPYLEIADVDTSNNSLVPDIKPDRFELFKSRRRSSRENPMQRARRAAEKLDQP